jgi:hypothetical protein
VCACADLAGERGQVFWVLPIGLMGQAWKLGLWRVFRPLFDLVDQSTPVHSFAAKYIYSKELYADFFVLASGLGLMSLAALGTVVYWQVTYDWLPWWLVYAYYFSWVGMGGRGMGGAYTLSHKEGHHRGGGLYRPWIANSVGNFWENWMGLIYGIVPYNFSTAHVFLHHKLNAGKGDTMYQWDLDRSSFSDFQLYQYRVLTYMTGWSSLTIFKDLADAGNSVAGKNYSMLKNGCMLYWVLFPVICMSLLVGVAGCSVLSSVRFMVLIWLEPLTCMTYFLAFINFAFHGFLELDEKGTHLACVNSTVITEGEDDYWGEDDHMAHHYFTAVSHRDLAAHQASQKDVWKKHKGSCFQKLSIVELAVLMLLKEWRRLAELHYVDHSRSMSVDEIAALLEKRARVKEMTYDEYEFEYLPTLRARAQDLVASGSCSNLDQALKQLSHTSSPLFLDSPDGLKCKAS